MNICICNINRYLCEYHKKYDDREQITFQEASLEDKIDCIKIVLDDLCRRFEILVDTVEQLGYTVHDLELRDLEP